MPSLSKPVTQTSIIAYGIALKDSGLAEALNNCFNDAICDIEPLVFNPLLVEHSTDNYVINPESVEEALLSIQEQSKGPDDIPNWILKNFVSVIHHPSCSIFNSSINQGHVPLLWKCANVIPINKVPQLTSISTDFRPISLTSVLSKIQEGFVFECLSAIIMPQVDPYQFWLC